VKTQPQPLTIILVVTIVTIAMLSYANARQIGINFIHNKHIEYKEDTSTTYEPSIGTNTLKLNNINIHVMRDFLYRYKDVNSEKWYGVEGGFVARFINGDIATTVTYKSNGEWLYTINSYDNKIMPEELRILVKRAYTGYDILHINEIEAPHHDSPIFLVYIQNTTTIKILRISEGEMEILHDYIRD